MKDRLKEESKFQDSRVGKEEVRFISDYDTLMNSFTKKLSQFENQKILSIGCGTGSFETFLARNNNRITAIDISPESIKKLEQTLHDEGVSNVQTKLMDAENLDFEDKTFDLIYGIAILHHLDLQNAIPEFKRVLKDNGRLLFIEPPANNYLVNRYRNSTPHMRSKFEHPLTDKDIRFIQNYFKTNISGFNMLITVMPSFVRHSKNFKFFRNVLSSTDKFLMNLFPSLKKYSYSIIIDSRR